jgi:aspartyl protease family protein
MRKLILYIFLLSISLMLFTDCTRHRSRDSKSSISRSNDRTEQTIKRERRTRGGKTIVKMRNENGVYYVPCKINGSEMQFIFDTGASDITMSLTEALFLYKQGKITDHDFKGKQQYQIADGSISEGTIVNLRSVTIGNLTLNNVQASIVHNLGAPLLLGQSALSEFGKITIDYKKHEIVFE